MFELICVMLVMILLFFYMTYRKKYESLTSTDPDTTFIDDMLKDDKMYEYVIINNYGLPEYLAVEGNTMSTYLADAANKNRVYNSIDNYIKMQSGKNNRLTTYISQGGLKMNNIINKYKFSY